MAKATDVQAQAPSGSQNRFEKDRNFYGTPLSREQRNRYLRQLDAAFHQIADNPRIGIDCGYIREGYRKQPFSSHLIFYRIGKLDVIEIVRVLHKHMDVERSMPFD